MVNYHSHNNDKLKGLIKDRERTRGQLYSQLYDLNIERDRYLGEYNVENPPYQQNKHLNESIRDDKKRKLIELNNQITVLQQQIANIDNEIPGIKDSYDRKYDDLVIDDKEETEVKFKKNKPKTDKIIKDVIPLKKQENVESENYYRLLSSQNKEVSMEINNQKHNLTTADRKYIVEDSKIPYYKELNNLLLIVYIIVAIYVSYKVFTGLITKNIYGKLIIILLISLYPIFIFNLEMVIYDQYKLIKSMIRAEPYEPVK